MKRLPALITYRSAVVMREEAMQFAYHQMGLRVAMGIATLSGAAYVRLTTTGADNLLAALFLAVIVAALAVAGYCGKTMNFPHSIRLSLEEWDMMRNDMGLSAEVLQQTRDAVVLGSEEDWKAGEQARAAVAKIQHASKEPIAPEYRD